MGNKESSAAKPTAAAPAPVHVEPPLPDAPRPKTPEGEAHAAAVARKPSTDEPNLKVTGLPISLTHRYGVDMADDTLLSACLVVSDALALFLMGSTVRTSPVCCVLCH